MKCRRLIGYSHELLAHKRICAEHRFPARRIRQRRLRPVSVSGGRRDARSGPKLAVMRDENEDPDRRMPVQDRAIVTPYSPTSTGKRFLLVVVTSDLGLAHVLARLAPALVFVVARRRAEAG